MPESFGEAETQVPASATGTAIVFLPSRRIPMTPATLDGLAGRLTATLDRWDRDWLERHSAARPRRL